MLISRGRLLKTRFSSQFIRKLHKEEGCSEILSTGASELYQRVFLKEEGVVLERLAAGKTNLLEKTLTRDDWEQNRPCQREKLGSVSPAALM